MLVRAPRAVSGSGKMAVSKFVQLPKAAIALLPTSRCKSGIARRPLTAAFIRNSCSCENRRQFAPPDRPKSAPKHSSAHKKCARSQIAPPHCQQEGAQHDQIRSRRKARNRASWNLEPAHQKSSRVASTRMRSRTQQATPSQNEFADICRRKWIKLLDAGGLPGIQSREVQCNMMHGSQGARLRGQTHFFALPTRDGVRCIPSDRESEWGGWVEGESV